MAPLLVDGYTWHEFVRKTRYDEGFSYNAAQKLASGRWKAVKKNIEREPMIARFKTLPPELKGHIISFLFAPDRSDLRVEELFQGYISWWHDDITVFVRRHVNDERIRVYNSDDSEYSDFNEMIDEYIDDCDCHYAVVIDPWYGTRYRIEKERKNK